VGRLIVRPALGNGTQLDSPQSVHQPYRIIIVYRGTNTALLIGENIAKKK